MDEDWEDDDIANGVFCTIVCGEPSPKDAGRNDILLCCRIYDREFQIPTLSDDQMNYFLAQCFAQVDKAGFETQRVGGSAGCSVATTDQLRYFSKYKAAYPIEAGAVVHIPVLSGRWRSYYVTPYRGPEVSDALCVHPYSSPKLGGAILWDYKIFSLVPHFFERMAKVRYTVTYLLDLIEKNGYSCISPVARSVQNQYSIEALRLAGKKNLWKAMSKQVVYSLVPYTVGTHKDVTRSGVSRELVECKACFRWPKYCLSHQNNLVPALGRGGFGYGVFTIMIVDHPEK